MDCAPWTGNGKSGQSSWVDLIGATGGPRFGECLSGFLASACGADHCTLFRIDADGAAALASGSRDGSDIAFRRASTYVSRSYWRRDLAMRDAQQLSTCRAPALIKVDIGSLGDSDFRDTLYPGIRERLVLAGRSGMASLGLSVLRTQERAGFSNAEVQALAGKADIVFSLLSKHCETVLASSAARALESLRQIDACVQGGSSMPAREREVCARILYGMSTAGMALDLGIGVESVKTYRRRIYRRLDIGGERELLAWYLRLWERWMRGGPFH